MLPDALFAAFHCRRRSRRAAEQVDKAFAAMAEIVSEFGNKPQSSELVQCRMECTLPIRRIIDDSIGLTGPWPSMVGAIFLLRPCNNDVTIVPAA
jgi:hypothetical protein